MKKIYLIILICSVLAVPAGIVCLRQYRYDNKVEESAVAIPAAEEHDGYNNYANGGQIAYCDGAIYYCRRDKSGEEIRKVKDGQDRHFSKIYQKLYSYNGYLYGINDKSVYMLNPDSGKSKKILTNVYEFVVGKECVYYTEFLNSELKLYRCSFTGDNAVLMDIDKPEKLFISQGNAYIVAGEMTVNNNIYKLNYATAELIAENISEKLPNILNANIVGKYVIDNGNAYNLDNGEIKKISCTKSIEELQNRLVYSLSYKDVQYVSVFPGKWDEWHRIDMYDGQEQAGLWKIDVINDEITKISDDYTIEYLAAVDEKSIIYLNGKSLCQTEIK